MPRVECAWLPAAAWCLMCLQNVAQVAFHSYCKLGAGEVTRSVSSRRQRVFAQSRIIRFESFAVEMWCLFLYLNA